MIIMISLESAGVRSDGVRGNVIGLPLAAAKLLCDGRVRKHLCKQGAHSLRTSEREVFGNDSQSPEDLSFQRLPSADELHQR